MNGEQIHMDPTVGVIGVDGFKFPVVYRLKEVIEDQVKPVDGGGTATFHIGTGFYRVIEARELGASEALEITYPLAMAIGSDVRKRGMRMAEAR